MKENKFLNKLKGFKSYGTVAAFICLEMLAFIGFALGHNLILYGSLAIAITVILLLVTFKEIKTEGIASYGLFLFPIVIFGVLSAISTYPTISEGAIGVSNAIFVPITLLFLSIAGYLVTKVQKFDVSKMLIVIYCSLGLFVLVNLIVTMIYYVPFYTIFYNNHFIVFDGKPSPEPINKMGYMLYGFSFQEVSIYYWRLFPAILSTSVVSLFLIKPKENKFAFFTYLACAVLGTLSLIITVQKYTVLTDLFYFFILGVVTLGITKPKTRKAIKYLSVIGTVLISLGLIFVAINAQTNVTFNASLKTFVANNELLNRLFNTNFIIRPINNTLNNMFSGYKLFGLGIGTFVIPDSVDLVIGEATICWYIDAFNTTGVFGVLLITLFVGLFAKKYVEYFKNSDDKLVEKALIIAFILGALGYMFVGYDSTPLIHYSETMPFYMFPPFLTAIFLMSFVCGKSQKKLENKTEETVTTKEENENEEISL